MDLENEMLEELNELQASTQSENVSQKRLYDRHLEDWNKKHELYQQIREQKRNEFKENQSRQRLWKLKELEIVKSTDALAAIAEQEIAKHSEDLTDIEWVDDVFEEAPPAPFKEAIFDEESHKKEIKQVVFYFITHITHHSRDSNILEDHLVLLLSILYLQPMQLFQKLHPVLEYIIKYININFVCRKSN